MKVRLTMPGAAVVVEMEELLAAKMFKELAGRLLGVESARVVKMQPRMKMFSQKHEETPEAEKREVQEPFDNTTDDYLQAKATAGDEEVAPVQPAEVTKPVQVDMPIRKYKGFLYIECEACEEVRGFCAKELTWTYRCKCSHETKLKDLVPLWMHCECGKRFKYMTNLDKFMFDINCIDCGSPVPVKWNENKRLYETIK